MADEIHIAHLLAVQIGIDVGTVPFVDERHLVAGGLEGIFTAEGEVIALYKSVQHREFADHRRGWYVQDTDIHDLMGGSPVVIRYGDGDFSNTNG